MEAPAPAEIKFVLIWMDRIIQFVINNYQPVLLMVLNAYSNKHVLIMAHRLYVQQQLEVMAAVFGKLLQHQIIIHQNVDYFPVQIFKMVHQQMLVKMYYPLVFQMELLVFLKQNVKLIQQNSLQYWWTRWFMYIHAIHRF